MRKHFWIVFCLMMFLAAVPVSAASIKNAKPKLDRSSAYMNNAVFLKWKKVSGAKKYEIQRAKINPKKRNTYGKWTKWAATKKLYIRKKASGDYRYRVRAVKGSTTSKWSSPRRIIAVRGRITDKIYTPPEMFLNYKMREGSLTCRLLISNKTKSDIGFVNTSSQATIYALDKTTGKLLKSWTAHLYVAEINALAKQIKAGQEKSVYFRSSMSEEDWAQYKDQKIMVTASFYPNPYVEPISTQMAIACTESVSESAVAGK